MKLENLVVYLPYNLRLRHFHGNEYVLDKDNFLFTVDIIGDIKPILRPMKEISTKSSDGFIHMVIGEIKEYLNAKYNESASSDWAWFINKIKFHSYMEQPYWLIQILAKHHFDIFGLLDKNEGVDINTITQ